MEMNVSSPIESILLFASRVRYQHFTTLLAGVVVAGWMTVTCNGAPVSQLRTVLLSGETVPGITGGITFDGLFGAPKLNTAGDLLTGGFLSGHSVDSTNDRGVWIEKAGTLELVARRGDRAPQTSSGVYFSSITSLSLNAAGQVAFRATLTGDEVDFGNNMGIWSEGNGILSRVMRQGWTQAPDTPRGITFSFISIDAFPWNDRGQTAFFGRLAGSGVDGTNDRGIWSEGTGELRLVARHGSQVPGMPAGVNFNFALGSNEHPALNGAGHTAFRVALSGSGVHSTNDKTIWLGGADILELVARSGSQAPGVPAGVNFSDFEAPTLNAAGEIAFRATLVGNGVDFTNNQGIWKISSGNGEMVARRGEHAPGTSNGVQFWTFEQPRINAEGLTAFVANLSGSGIDSTNNRGIWLAGSGSLDLIARRGSPAPGTPDGVNFSFAETLNPALNAMGQIAFYGSLAGIGVDDTNDQGIWATDLSGELKLIARTGDLLEVAPFDYRTISALSFARGTGSEDGRSSGFNDLGQLAFRASFTDGSQGIFVSSLVVIPEPGTLAWIFIGSILSLTQRWR